MVNFRPYMISILISGLFAFVLLAGGIQLAVLNNANQSIADEPAIRTFSQSINETLLTTSDAAQAAENATSDSQITRILTIPFLDAIQGIWKTIKVAPVAIYNLIAGLAKTYILGSTAGLIITTLIAAIVTLTILFSVIKFVSTGDAG